MKVLHITTGLKRGGSETAMHRLIVNNPENTHVVLCLADTGPYEAILRADNIEVHLLHMKSHKLPLVPLYHLYRLIRTIRPDVVQTWMYHANLIGGTVARLAGVKQVFWGLRMSSPIKGKIKRSTRFISNLSARFGALVPEKIISCADRATAEHIKIGYPENKIVTVYNGYDTDFMSYQASCRQRYRSQWGVSEADTVFGLVARWDPVKDHCSFAKAMAALKQSQPAGWKCVWVGPELNEQNPEVMALLNEHDLTEQCLLMGAQKDVRGIMSALDVHVLTSTDEGFPNVIAEAMSCSVPCISTDAGDARQIVGDFGWVVPVGGVTALTKAMQVCITEHQDAAGWQQRKERCRATVVERFGIAGMVAGFERVWASTSPRASS